MFGLRTLYALEAADSQSVIHIVEQLFSKCGARSTGGARRYCSVRGTMDKTQLEKSFYNLSQKSDILENAFGELKQEMDMLQISLNNLSEEIVKLQGIISELVEGRCPESWLRFNSSCYVISAVTTTWNEGRQNCTEKDADLVIINSKAEQEYLNDMVKNFKEVWIGLSDSDNEGMWKWVDGTPLTESLKFWKSGEPNDSNGNEDCAVLSRQTQSSPKPFSVRGNPATLQTWNDIPCYRSLPFICERKLL
ncbi:hypothetical protein ACEWY4_007230 [Coilia grayii]|uniref:C-type lectin domain-containing protein n=1 Tax=Coilia grayii TaxID=363190 RepID=A0ABD1KFV6_9TELE